MFFNILFVSFNVGLICAYVSLIFCHCKIIKLQRDLSSASKQVYQKLRKQRLRNYIFGLWIAIIFGLYFLKIKMGLSKFQLWNIILFSLLFVPIIVYSMIPTPSYLLDSDDTTIVVKDWFRVYQCMKLQFIWTCVVTFLISFGIMCTFYRQV